MKLARLLLLALLLTGIARGETRELCYDFDDNLFVTDAHMALWDRENRKEVPLDTATWSITRDQVGKDGPYRNMVIRPESFLELGDTTAAGADLFRRQVERVLPGGKWKGPAWPSFVAAMKDAALRERVCIITARRHAPSSVLAGLVTLKKKGLLAGVPKEENIYAVGWPKLPEKWLAPTLPERKAKVILERLDTLDKVPDPKGHIWAFSDDDYTNFLTAAQTLAPFMVSQRWPRTQIRLAYTGLNRPDQRPRCEVLQATGESRPCTPAENAQTFDLH